LITAATSHHGLIQDHGHVGKTSTSQRPAGHYIGRREQMDRLFVHALDADFAKGPG
jgi:hypothetical protein